MYHGLTSNLILVLLFVLIILVIFGCSQRSLLYFPSNEIIDISNHNDTGLKEVELTTSDGLVLKSWFKEPNTPKGFTILIFHGNAGHIGDRIEKFKRFIDASLGLFSTEDIYKATILEAPYTSIADVAQRHYWFLPAKWLVLDRYEILEIINTIKSPLMVIHGEQDNVISIEFGKKVFDAAPEPKEALFIPNAGHNNLFDFYADEKILVYLDKQLNF